ncbi:MAG: hypothetical protein EBZ11_08190, partial [Alphaproteobacteria bacterium]|nr:hypothetical protein [Alphaproteobacteria bacterium]
GVFTANTPVVSVNSETGEIEIDFEWSAATDVDPGDAVSYRLEFGEDADNVTSYDAGTELAFMLSSTGNFEDNSVYYWRIVATDNGGLTTENTGGFARVSINTEEEGPTDFTLLAPEAQQMVSSLEPTLRWTAPTDPDDGSLQALGAGAGGLRVIDGYRVYWSTSESALGDEALDSETSTLTPDIVTTTSYTFDEGVLSDNTVYYWRVEAFDDTDRSTRSGIGEFATNLVNESPSELSVEPISLGINAEDATVIDASLTWSGGEDVDPYDAVVVSLEVSDAEDFSSEVFGLADATSGASIAGLSENGVYYWRLTATDASGATSSTSARFIVDLTEEAPSVVSLTAPGADA